MRGGSPHDFDAVVVGAGPAGSSTALQLASRGRRVLLVDARRFPRDKSCGDGLTRSAVASLKSMGVLSSLGEPQQIRGLRLLVEGEGRRDVQYDEGQEGLVVRRFELDQALVRHARGAGAEVWEGMTATSLLFRRGAVRGVSVGHGRDALRITSRVVVLADGSTSRLGRQAGTHTTPTRELGYAVRGYYRSAEPLEPYLHVFFPVVSGSTGVLPAYGWAFPLSDGMVNVGVGVARRPSQVNLRSLFGWLLKGPAAELHLQELQGRWRGAPLRFDFDPERSWRAGLLAVGDAVGLVSPFTGEGIAFGLESGGLAAEVIDQQLSETGECEDLGRYERELSGRYLGYFQTGQQALRRHRVMTRMVRASFRREGPLFTLCRHVALASDSARSPHEPARDAVGERGLRLMGQVRADMLEVDEIALQLLGRDWPFLARMLSVGHQRGRTIPRPSSVLLTATRAGAAEAEHRISLATAADLSLLAYYAYASVENAAEEQTAYGPDWANRFAVMAGDLLVARVAEVLTDVPAAAADSLVETMATICNSEVLIATGGSERYTASAPLARLYEEVAALGGASGRLADEHVAVLRRFGRYTGAALSAAEDAKAITRKPLEGLGTFSARSSGDLARQAQSEEELTEKFRAYAAQARDALEESSLLADVKAVLQVWTGSLSEEHVNPKIY